MSASDQFRSGGPRTTTDAALANMPEQRPLARRRRQILDDETMDGPGPDTPEREPALVKGLIGRLIGVFRSI